ncbi:MAG: rRNA maturation RNAse YbeY [Christensenellaceae bacterium]
MREAGEERRIRPFVPPRAALPSRAGILHCLGYDHETETEKSEMREKRNVFSVNRITRDE